jgi:hypothetical protein
LLSDLQEQTRILAHQLQDMAGGKLDLSWLENHQLHSPPLDYDEMTTTSSPAAQELINNDQVPATEAKKTDTSLTQLLQQLNTMTNSPPPATTAKRPPSTAVDQPQLEPFPSLPENNLPADNPPPPPEENVQLHRLQQTPPNRWITETTNNLISQTLALKEDGMAECRTCAFTGTKKRTRIHIKQHYVWQFCRCKFYHISRDAVRNHQQQCDNPGGPFEVDQETFPAFLEAMNWTDPPTWTPCQPTRIGPQHSPTVPPPLPAPTGYRIPLRQPPSISPVRPPTIPSLMESPAPLPVHRHPDRHRHNPLTRRPSRTRRRLAPLSTGIPRRMEQFNKELGDYQHALEDEVTTLRRDQLEYRRRTPQYEDYGQEIRRLNDTIRQLRHARRVLVAPQDNQ